MPRIADLELEASGRRRRAELRVTGTVLFDRSEARLNGAYLRVRLHAVDSRIRSVEDVGELRSLCDAWFVRGRMERYEPVMRWSGRHSGSDNWLGGQINASDSDRARFRFTWDNRRVEAVPSFERAFNEDRPGKDEIVAVALCLPSLPDGSPFPEGEAAPVLSNTVSRRF